MSALLILQATCKNTHTDTERMANEWNDNEYFLFSKYSQHLKSQGTQLADSSPSFWPLPLDSCLSFISRACPLACVPPPLYQALFNPIIYSLSCLTTVCCLRPLIVGQNSPKYFSVDMNSVSLVFKEVSPRSYRRSCTALPFAESVLLTC